MASILSLRPHPSVRTQERPDQSIHVATRLELPESRRSRKLSVRPSDQYRPNVLVTDSRNLLRTGLQGRCSLPRPLRERRHKTQTAVRQGVLWRVAVFVVADVCVSRASQRSTFCFFSTPGTFK
jgi:hypothetical protein